MSWNNLNTNNLPEPGIILCSFCQKEKNPDENWTYKYD